MTQEELELMQESLVLVRSLTTDLKKASQKITEQASTIEQLSKDNLKLVGWLRSWMHSQARRHPAQNILLRWYVMGLLAGDQTPSSLLTVDHRALCGVTRCPVLS